MAICDVCGNDYDNAFTVRTTAGEELTFDSIECAANRIAPTCSHCGCRILGHGVQATDQTYCCAHCAREQGADGVQDRA
ncbi:MAG TPA: hypothetical protein VHJ79_16620 [Mycobacterium sp.]|jgi:hypothetical protein|nr:hypothetical protein [Mycobacterium sp.]